MGCIGGSERALSILCEQPFAVCKALAAEDARRSRAVIAV